MKKRILASLMSLCLLVGLLPTVAFAVEETFPTEQAEQTVVCTCEAPCTVESKDETCPVCVEDYTLCAAQAEPTTTEPGNDQEPQFNDGDISGPAEYNGDDTNEHQNTDNVGNDVVDPTTEEQPAAPYPTETTTENIDNSGNSGGIS